MLIIQGYCFIQSLHFSYELQEDSVQDSKQCSSVPLYPSERRGIPSERSSVKASSIWTIRTFRPDALQNSTSKRISFQNKDMGRQL
jgi:hypothetical protein